MRIMPNDLEAHWMPFTSNKHFKNTHTRMMTEGKENTDEDLGLEEAMDYTMDIIRQPLGAQCSEPPRESRWPRDPAQVEPRWPVCPGGRDGIPLPTPHAAPRGARVNEVLEHSRSIFSFQSTR